MDVDWAEKFEQIDRDRLDWECRRQARLVYYFSQLEAEAKKKHATAKSRADVTEAEMALEVRTCPSDFNLPDKPTEAAFKAAVVASLRCKNAEQDVIMAAYDLDMIKAALTALYHKKTMLDDEVQLHLTHYRTAETGTGTNGQQPAVRAAVREYVTTANQAEARVSAPAKKPPVALHPKAKKKTVRCS